MSVESPEWVIYDSSFHAIDTGLVRTLSKEMSSLQPGKVPPHILEKFVFTHLGKKHPDLILGPGLGQDASLIRFGNRVLVASTDPITGSV